MLVALVCVGAGASFASGNSGDAPFAAHHKPKLAVLPFSLFDESVEGELSAPDAAQEHRIKLCHDDVETILRRSGRYDVVDTSDHLATLERISVGQPFSTCHGCELDAGKALGADLVLLGWVHKTSNLILALFLQLEDVRTGKIIASKAIQIRSNTDRSWKLGFRHLVDQMMLNTG